MNTKNYELVELENLEKNYTGGINVYPSVIYKIDCDYLADLVFCTSCLNENIDKAVDLLIDIRDNTLIDDKRLLEIILEQKNRLQMNISNSGHGFAAKRTLSYTNEAISFENELGGINYYDFLCKLATDFNKEDILNKFDFIRKTYFTKENLTVSYGGEKIEVLSKPLLNFMSNLGDTFSCTDSFEFKEEKLNEGIKTPSNVVYVSRGSNYKKLGFEYTGAIEVLRGILSTDYLWQEVRVKGGAYGCMIISDMSGNFAFTSYRDPNILQTSNTYLNSVNYIKAINLSDEELLKNIIGTIGTLDAPVHVSLKISKAFINSLRGVTNDMLVKQRKEIINVTNKDLNSLADLIQGVLNTDCLTVIGDEKNIEKNKEMFKNIRKL